MKKIAITQKVIENKDYLELTEALDIRWSKLFKKLDLQMLIVTPKQKINVIAPYVGSVHFVFNKDNESALVDMPVEKLREKGGKIKSE